MLRQMNQVLASVINLHAWPFIAILCRLLSFQKLLLLTIDNGLNVTARILPVGMGAPSN